MRTIGIFPEGTVRFGMTYLNRLEEVGRADLPPIIS